MDDFLIHESETKYKIGLRNMKDIASKEFNKELQIDF